jgi:hypothetical protein
MNNDFGIVNNKYGEDGESKSICISKVNDVVSHLVISGTL